MLETIDGRYAYLAITGSERQFTASLIAQTFGGVVIEDGKENPYLRDYVLDSTNWAFRYWTEALSNGQEQMEKIVKALPTTSVVAGWFQEAYLGAEAQYRKGVITPSEWEALASIYTVLSRNLPQPDLIVWLDKPDGHDGLLRGLYTSWFETNASDSMCMFDATRFDLGTRESDQHEFLNRLEHRFLGHGIVYRYS